jgi:transcriptional antiterminator RfaH
MKHDDAAADPAWHAVAVEGHRERYARDNLLALELGVYLPRIEEQARHARRTYTVERPLFPGYLFVALDPTRLSAVNTTRGVIGVLRSGGCLAPLKPGALAALRALEDTDGVIRPKRALAERFRPGDKVRVTDGVWGGLIGEVLTVKGAERVRLLLGALRAEIGAAQLERV